MKRFWIISLLFTGILLLTGCSPRQVIKEQPSREFKPRVITNQQNDSLSYVIEFGDNTRRDLFLASFKKFLKNYPFVELYNDSIAKVVFIKILPASGRTPDSFFPFDKSRTIENIIEETIDSSMQDTTVTQLQDTIMPEYGGTARLYIQRSALDPTFSTLIGAYPFTDDTTTGLLSVIDSSSRKITLQLTGKTLNGKNKVLSALDLIDLWTKFIKKQPAEGIALFRYVEGINSFIEGKEAIVRGFGALNQNTVYLRLSRPDPHALERLKTHRTFGSAFKLGSYHVEREENEFLTLFPNPRPVGQKPFLDKLVLRMGGDANPILSFSLNKYDAVVLTSTGDIKYARENLSGNALLLKIPSDRYFIACAAETGHFKQYLSKQIDPEDLLQNFVKAEGMPISAIESDSLFEPEFTENDNVKPIILQQQRILYRKDDPVSKIIAEKLLADLSNYEIPSTLIAATPLEYQQALLHNDYDCAVGWVPQDVTHNRSEKLRLASMWFDDITDQSRRLAEKREIPLFTINNYLLIRNNFGLFRDQIRGIYSKQ